MEMTKFIEIISALFWKHDVIFICLKLSIDNDLKNHAAIIMKTCLRVKNVYCLLTSFLHSKMSECENEGKADFVHDSNETK